MEHRELISLFDEFAWDALLKRTLAAGASRVP